MFQFNHVRTLFSNYHFAKSVQTGNEHFLPLVLATIQQNGNTLSEILWLCHTQIKDVKLALNGKTVVNALLHGFLTSCIYPGTTQCHLLSMSKPDTISWTINAEPMVTISSAINVNVHRNISRYDQVNKYGDYCIYYKTNYAVRPRKLWYRKTTYSVRLKL